MFFFYELYDGGFWECGLLSRRKILFVDGMFGGLNVSNNII